MKCMLFCTRILIPLCPHAGMFSQIERPWPPRLPLLNDELMAIGVNLPAFSVLLS
jgi:hypothetical protein